MKTYISYSTCKDNQQFDFIQILMKNTALHFFLFNKSENAHICNPLLMNNMKSFTLNCNGKIINIEQPIIMGIINVTPDSFYTQGRNSDLKGILHAANNMLDEGAAILDIGGLSTRPGSESITAKEEIDRVIPAIEQIKKYFPQSIISVDTYRSEVAIAAYEYGADIINDISAGALDPMMLSSVALIGTPYIAMHMQGNPKNMQQQPQYDQVGVEVLQYCANKLGECRQAGIKDVIIDPGFGFGKSIAHNYALLRHLHTFHILETPILVGISRKSMLYKPLEIEAAEALNATTAAHMLALNEGAHILRVHDVKAANEAIKIWQLYKQAP